MSRRSPLGPVGHRLLLAFVLVTAFSVVVVTGAALIGVGRGLSSSQAVTRQDAATAAAAAAARAYAAHGTWSGADLSQASAVAEAAGARLFVVSVTGEAVGLGGAAGNPAMGQNGPGGPPAGNGTAGQGRGATGPVGGTGVYSATVSVDGADVGTVRLVFPVSTLTRARDVAWTWIGLAAAAALVLALVAGWVVTRLLTGPIARTTRAARSFAAGDRTARTEVRGPGELAELAQAFNAMADAVTRSERDRRNLTADVAHELRTPLAALQAGLEELRDGLVEPDAARLAGLHDQALRLGRIVADLAELSAAEAEASVSVERVPVDLARLAADEVAARDPQLRAAGLDVELSVDGPADVLADADRLHQALGNVLANAARYCAPGDRVSVQVGTADGDAVLEVTDTGPGIPADELPHVFDRLWRGRGAARVAGSGIGLAVAREIVVAHGGTIEVASDEGAGTTVTIRLPLAPSPQRLG